MKSQNTDTRNALGLLLILVLVAAGALSACNSPDPTPAALDAESARTAEKVRVQWLIADKTTVEQGGLTVSGAATLSGASTLASLTVSGATALDGGLTMDTNKFTVDDTTGNVATAGTLTVAGAAALNGGITVDTSNFTVNGTTGAVSTASNLTVGGTAKVTGNTIITGTLTADKLATFTSGIKTASTVWLDNNTIYCDLSNTAAIAGAAGAIEITVPATGTVTINNGGFVAPDVTVSDDLTVADDTIITGTLDVAGDLTVNGNKLTVSATTGDITLAAGAQILPTSGITQTSAVFSCINNIAYTDTTTKTMCVIPANANIIDYLISTGTAFNDSGTDYVDCGTTYLAATELFSNAPVNTAAVSRPGVTTALGDVGAVALPIYCLYQGQNSDASAGLATVVVYYVVD